MRYINIIILLFVCVSVFGQALKYRKNGTKVEAYYETLEVPIVASILSLTPEEFTKITTKGFYDDGDGGEATYTILKSVPTGLQVDTATVIPTANGNYAVLDNYKNVNVAQLGVYIDSTLIPVHIAQRVQRIANLGNVEIHCPAGKYNMSRRITNLSGISYYFIYINGEENIKITGDAGGTKFYYHNTNLQTDFQTPILISNSNNITVEGIQFIGDVTNDDDKDEDVRPAVIAYQNVVNLKVKDCIFVSCTPVSYYSSNGHNTFEFSGNYIEDAPNSINPCDIAFFTKNTFKNTDKAVDRSHAIYAYGGISDINVTSNYFENITGYALKFRGENGTNATKKTAIFSNNTCKGSVAGTVDLGTNLSDIAIYTYIVNNNTFEDCNIGVTIYNASNATIIGNSFFWGLSSTLTTARAINLAGTAEPRDAKMRNINIAHNVIENIRNVLSEITLNALPNENDTLKIDTFLYTFKASPTSFRDIQIEASLQLQVEAIIDKLKLPYGYGGLVGIAAVQTDDIKHNTSPAKIFLNLKNTYTISTNLNITYVRDQVDYRQSVTGIICAFAFEPIIVESNIFQNSSQPISISNSYKPSIKNNTINGYQNVVNITLTSNFEPVFEGNIIDNRFNSSTTYRVDIRENWMTTVRNNKGFPTLSFANSYLDFFSANVSKRLAGTGKAENIFWFGNVNTDTDSTDYSNESWNHGDKVILDSASTTLYTFTYKKQGSLDANDFTTKAQLITLINATSQFDAIDPNTSDATGTFKITAASSGTAGNDFKIRTISSCRMCGKYLNENFVGGSANPDVTVFWTPDANTHNAPSVTPINSGATSLTGVYVDVANSVVGKYYLIKHSNAAGTEQFLIKL